MFFNFRAITYRNELEKLERKLNSSEKNGNKHCSRCTLCCWRRPGTLIKSDVKKIAKYLKITKEKLFEKYLAVDEIYGILCLIPIRKNQKHIAGEYVTTEETYNISKPCIFLNQKTKSCNINNVKPHHCKSHSCWIELKENAKIVTEWEKEDLEKLGWDGCTEDLDY